MSSDTTPNLVQEINDYLEVGWTCPPDAQRMLGQAAEILEDSLRSKPSATDGPVVSYDALVDWVTRLEVTVKPVNGVVTIMAESMADAIAGFLRENGIEVSDG